MTRPADTPVSTALDCECGVALADYRAKFPERSPNLQYKKNDDELDLISPGDGDLGVEHLKTGPFNGAVIGAPPTKRKDEGTSKYLWVITSDNVPVLLESGTAGSKLSRGYASHTNLTGGDMAHVGGELWFIDKSSIALNGKSSRYLPRSEEELHTIESTFTACGFRVENFGWDKSTDQPYAFRRDNNG